MTKSELIQAVADNTDVDRNTAEKIINETLEVIKSELKSDNDVAIQNFGVFKCIWRDEREGTNPRTGEKITIAAHKLPIFKASKVFKKSVN